MSDYRIVVGDRSSDCVSTIVVDPVYQTADVGFINKPSLFLFRESNLGVMNKLDYQCNPLEIKGLDGYACIVD